MPYRELFKTRCNAARVLQVEHCISLVQCRVLQGPVQQLDILSRNRKGDAVELWMRRARRHCCKVLLGKAHWKNKPFFKSCGYTSQSLYTHASNSLSLSLTHTYTMHNSSPYFGCRIFPSTVLSCSSSSHQLYSYSHLESQSCRRCCAGMCCQQILCHRPNQSARLPERLRLHSNYNPGTLYLHTPVTDCSDHTCILTSPCTSIALVIIIIITITIIGWAGPYLPPPGASSHSCILCPVRCPTRESCMLPLRLLLLMMSIETHSPRTPMLSCRSQISGITHVCAQQQMCPLRGEREQEI